MLKVNHMTQEDGTIKLDPEIKQALDNRVEAKDVTITSTEKDEIEFFTIVKV